MFDRNRDGNYELYSMNEAGNAVDRLTNSASPDELPVCSADGSQVAFVSDRGHPSGEIYTMNANGAGVTQITHNLVGDYHSAFSPSGARIAFATSDPDAEIALLNADGGGAYEICSMNEDGSGVTRLTDAPASAPAPPCPPTAPGSRSSRRVTAAPARSTS